MEPSAAFSNPGEAMAHLLLALRRSSPQLAVIVAEALAILLEQEALLPEDLATIPYRAMQAYHTRHFADLLGEEPHNDAP